MPRSLLRRFTTRRGADGLYVYDKREARSFPSTVNDVAVERDFYSVEIGEKRVSWESAFQLVDDRLAALVGAVESAASLADVPPEIAADIPLLVATQLLRTKLQRTSPKQLAEHLQADGYRESGRDTPELSDARWRLLHLRRLLDVDKVAEEIRTKDWLLLEASDPRCAVWISDNPVVLHNSFPYGRLGIAAPGVEMYLPVSRSRVLGFFCPSIATQLRESLDPMHPRPALSGSLGASLLLGIDEGIAVSVGTEYVRFLNSQQVAQSSRFIFSPDSEFELAETLLAAAPELGSVESLVTIGEMGAGPPALVGMPAGTFLIMERGTNHYAIAAADRSSAEGHEGIQVEILDPAKLATISLNSPFDSIELVTDSHRVRGARNVVLERVEQGRSLYRVLSADPRLRMLMEHIRRDT